MVFPEQMVDVSGVAMAAGIGLTTMVTEVGASAQPLKAGTMLYVTESMALLGLVRVCMIVGPLPGKAPTIEAPPARVHVKVAPGTGEDNCTLVVPPLQKLVGPVTTFNCAAGVTETVAVSFGPTHPLSVGVIMY